MKRIIASLAVVCMLTTLTNTKVVFADLSDGLVAYYPFTGNANDESGNGNNGTIYGATLTTDRLGNTNKAYSFDMVDDYIRLPNSTTLDNLQESNYSVSAWFKPNSTPTVYDETKDSAYGIVMKPGKHAGIRYGKVDGINEKFVFEHWLNLSNDDDAMKFAVSGNTYSPGQFYHIVGILNKTDGVTKIYINGQLDGQKNFTDGSNTREYENAKWSIGIGDPSSSRDSARYAADGIIDEVRIYNRALSESEIQELYNEVGSTTPTPTATPTATLVQTPTPTPTVTETVTTTPTPSESGIVFGYVYDEDENPLRSVTVKIDGDNYSDSDTTDEDGYYEFDKVPDGDYTITYTKTGYVTQTAETTVTDGDKIEIDTVVMQVAQKGSIYGYVVDIKGNPIESVRLTFNGIGIKVKKTASTDSDGFFEFKDLEAGIYRIVAKKRFYKAAQQTVALEEGEDKEIEIEMKKTTKRIMMEGVQD